MRAGQAAEDASFFLRRDGEGSGTYARRIFQRVFTADIERVIRMEVPRFDACRACWFLQGPATSQWAHHGC